MSAFLWNRFHYTPLTFPIAAGLGVLPPLAGVAVDDTGFRLRFGPWFVLACARDRIASAEVVADEERPTIPAKSGPGTLTLRTSGGPLARLSFTEPTPGRWLVMPKRWGLTLSARHELRELSFTPHDPEAIVAALR